MILKSLLWLLALTSSVASAHSVPHRSHELTVSTSSGTVNGFVDKKTPNVRQFLGIPFAQPPTGQLRWLPPRPLDHPLHKPINATKYPLACPQFPAANLPTYTTYAPQWSVDPKRPQSEDCLQLSIWTPREGKCREKLPVFIWIYGGGFQTGATDVEYQLPMNWIERSQDHIVVGIQYRLNIFGYPNAASLKSQNLGILDQRLATEWVRDNIAAFGGDPNRIVLWGQSAGAESVDYLNFAYPSDTIAYGQICDSGSSMLPITSFDYSHSNFSSVAAHFGCTNKATEVACLRKVSHQDIVAYLQAYNNAGTSPALYFAPIADERVIFANYSARYAAGKVARIPAIFGTNADEGESLIPNPQNPEGPPNHAAAVAFTNSGFLCPAVTSTKLRAANGLQTYRYYYTGNFTNVSPRYWLGAYHSSELPHIFGTSTEYRGKDTPLERRVGEAMQDLWVSFAEDPSRATGWTEVRSGQALVFAADGKAVQKGSLQIIDAPCL